MSFQNYTLDSKTLKVIEDLAYRNPTDIQNKVIPFFLQKKDILAQAPTGTGKTASFLIPLVELAVKQQTADYRPIFALILSPTRELALQTSEQLAKFAKPHNLAVTTIFGGVKSSPQVKRIQKGIDILVATPGRLIEFILSDQIVLDDLNHIIIDEADKMLDFGFSEDIEIIKSKIPAYCHKSLFSATFNQKILKIARDFLGDPVEIHVDHAAELESLIEQRIYFVPKSNRTQFISEYIKNQNLQQALIFGNTRFRVMRLANHLNSQGLQTMALHGQKTQKIRNIILDHFRNQEVSYLVATDLASRGLDINYLPYIINYELPYDFTDYLHRIGRTGRSNHCGVAISFAWTEDLEQLKKIFGDFSNKIKFFDRNLAEMTDQLRNIGNLEKYLHQVVE